VPPDSVAPHAPPWPWVVLGLAGALAAGALAGWWVSNEVRAELALRPPALVLDLAAAVRSAPPEAVDELLARQLATARQLAAGGFLVLDAQAVLAAPPGLTVTPPGAVGETKR
jgi:hypothetical protein